MTEIPYDKSQEREELNQENYETKVFNLTGREDIGYRKEAFKEESIDDTLDKANARGESKAAERDANSLQTHYYQEGYSWEDAKTLVRVRRIAQDEYEKRNSGRPINEEIMNFELDRTVAEYIRTHEIKKENEHRR